MWFWYFAILSFTWGACIGSFLNVCIYRIPQDESVVRPRSHCPHCGTPIRWYHNIPLLSYLQLRGRCAYCGTPYSVRYFVVELLVAVLFLLAFLKLSPVTGRRVLALAPINNWALVLVYWLMISGLTLGTFVDFDHFIIPDRVSIGGIIAGLVLSAVVPDMHGKTSMLGGFLASLIGAAVGFGLLWSVGALGTFVFKKEAMGFGDVKLLGAIGAFLGWHAVLFTVLVSSFVGAVVGITLVAIHRTSMQSRIPFGPYLALAALIWVFWGPALWAGYINLLSPSPSYGL